MARVTDPGALAALYPEALPSSLVKVTDRLTPSYRAFVEAAPFVVLATSGPRGIDVTPRGDPAPVVAVEDARTLLLPDRHGNNRLDSLRNILADPRVGLLFLIPGAGETLRIAGTAEVLADPALAARFAIEGRPPASVLRIAVAQVYCHCSKAVARARLWDPAAQVPRDRLPRMGEMLAEASAAPVDAAAETAAYEDRQRRLY
jgi:PPOX class probable FMN-dependent enzyme